MNKLWILLLPLAMLMTACGVEDDEEEVEEIRLVHRSTDDVDNGEVDSSTLYDFVLTADDTEYTLKGELNDIKITGNRNTINFGESLEFDKLVITGTGNRVNTPEIGESEYSVTANNVFVTVVGNEYAGVTAQATPITSFTVTTEEQE